MGAYYLAAALLWILLAALACVLLVVMSPGAGLSAVERIASAGVILLLGVPLGMQAASLRAGIREMGANFLRLDERGLRIRLTGRRRVSKGLPEVPETVLLWNAITAVTTERRSFLYRSATPFAYPLDVYTIVTHGGAIAFTRECLAGAKRAAREVAARIGQEVHVKL